MLNHTFTFNGHTSDEFGIKIERFRALSRPGRKFDSASVPGRNGILYKLQEAWEEILVSYEIFAGDQKNGEPMATWEDMNPVTFNEMYSGKTVKELTFFFPKVLGPTAPNVITINVNGNVNVTLPVPMYGGTYDYISGTLIVTSGANGVDLPDPVVYQLTPHSVTTISGQNTFGIVTPASASVQKIRVSSTETLNRQWTNIMEWLNSADGYAELTDTYDPEHYYQAVFVDGPEIANSWNRYGRAVVSFRCRPERFLSDAEVVLSDLEQADVGHITSDPVNLRKGPGTSYPIFAWLRTNDKFAILDTKTADSITWYKICTLDRKKEGWCDSQYVATEQMYLLVNPTNHIAKPTIRFDVVSNTINDADISINDTKIDIDTGAVLFYSTTIDCENENVSGVDQSYEEQPFNSYATVTTLNGATTTQFLKLEPGNNYLDSSLATSVSVVITINPHFWEI